MEEYENKSWEEKTQYWPQNTFGLFPDQEKQHLRSDQVFPVHIAFCLPLESMGLVLLWRLQASMSSLRV